MTDAYLNTILEDQFGASSGNTFYVGLISSTNFTGIDKANDSMSSHPGWQEFTSVGGTRPQWVPGTVTDQQITNPTAASFTPTDDGEAVGFFITTNSSVGGIGGTLVDMILFAEAAELISGEAFTVDWINNARDIGN